MNFWIRLLADMGLREPLLVSALKSKLLGQIKQEELELICARWYLTRTNDHTPRHLPQQPTQLQGETDEDFKNKALHWKGWRDAIVRDNEDKADFLVWCRFTVENAEMTGKEEPCAAQEKGAI